MKRRRPEVVAETAIASPVKVVVHEALQNSTDVPLAVQFVQQALDASRVQITINEGAQKCGPVHVDMLQRDAIVVCKIHASTPAFLP